MIRPHGATWRSGYATVCKTVYTSSILVVASTPNNLILRRYLVRRRLRQGSMIPARKWLPASTPRKLAANPARKMLTWGVSYPPNKRPPRGGQFGRKWSCLGRIIALANSRAASGSALTITVVESGDSVSRPWSFSLHIPGRFCPGVARAQAGLSSARRLSPRRRRSRMASLILDRSRAG